MMDRSSKENAAHEYINHYLNMSNDSDVEEDKENDVKWYNIAKLNKWALKDLLMERIANNENTDVIVNVHDTEFYCHTILLRIHSGFFEKIATCPVIHIKCKQVSIESFKNIYKWMKSPGEIVNKKNVIGLFTASRFLKINSLSDQCWTYIENQHLFYEESAFKLYLKARDADELIIQNLMIKNIYKYFLPLVASHLFLILTINDILMLFNSNEIGVNNESEVFLAGVSWLSYDWVDRQKYVVEIMKCIRFGNMDTCFLIQLKHNIFTIEEILRILKYPEVKELIARATEFKTLSLAFSERNDYNKMLLIKKYEVPKRRGWVYDPLCEYHHRLHCPNKYVEYSMFHKYLKKLGKQQKNYYKSFIDDKGSDSLPICCNLGRKPCEEGIPRISVEFQRKCSEDNCVNDSEIEDDEGVIFDD